MLRRFSVFSLALLLCLSLFPARAFADVGSSSVLWSGFINDGAQFGAFVKGGTRYDAAAAALGYDSSRLSDEVKAKLSDSGYGGMFYTFANAFSSVSSPIEIPSWVPVFVTTSSVIADLLNNISGSNYPHWSVAVTQSVYDLAFRDFLAVLNGGDVEGGGGGNVSEYSEVIVNSTNVVLKKGTPPKYVCRRATIGSDGSVTIGSGTVTYSDAPASPYYVSTARFYVSPLWQSVANGYIAQGKKVIVGASPRAVTNPAAFFFLVCDSYTVSRHVNPGDSNSTKDFLVLVNGYYYDSRGNAFYADGIGPFFVVLPADDPSGSVPVSGEVSPDYWAELSSTAVPPAGTWPDSPEPASPVAPELPEPAEPVVETPVSPTVPTPVWPDITINIDNDPTPGTTPSGLDYTELLTRINDNLISIDAFVRAINSNLNSLRGDLLAEFNGVFDSLRNIYNYLLTIDSVLETHCTHLRNKMEESAVFIANYMRTLIKWLADQLDYDDMTNVEAPDNSLLTTINEKLGGGTYEPNPIKDEQGYYEWLDDLWDRFLLGDNWQSSMGSISGSFSELKTRFPFSVPWDIVALFRLFVHDPVTPVFDLPLYFSSDGSTPVHVDLSPWDSVASLVRPMVFVIFALKLALLSRDLLGGLGADKGGL